MRNIFSSKKAIPTHVASPGARMRPILIAVCTLCISALLTSCAKEKDVYIFVEWAPVALYVQVQDEEGNDLINPDTEENLIEGTTLTYKDTVYTLSTEWYDKYNPTATDCVTKSTTPEIYGLYLTDESMNVSTWDKSKTPRCRLYFGLIDGAADMDEDMVITWPDGSKDTIHYHCSDHVNINTVSVNRYWTLNGSVSDNPVTIIKQL